MIAFAVGSTYTAPSVNKPVTGGEGVPFTVVKRTAKYVTVTSPTHGERRRYIYVQRSAAGDDYEYVWLCDAGRSSWRLAAL